MNEEYIEKDPSEAVGKDPLEVWMKDPFEVKPTKYSEEKGVLDEK